MMSLISSLFLMVCTLNDVHSYNDVHLISDVALTMCTHITSVVWRWVAGPRGDLSPGRQLTPENSGPMRMAPPQSGSRSSPAGAGGDTDLRPCSAGDRSRCSVTSCVEVAAIRMEL